MASPKKRCASLQAPDLDLAHDGFKFGFSHAREEVAAGATDERGAQEFRGIDICGGVKIGVDVAVRPVVQVDGWDAIRAALIYVVVAARREIGKLCEQSLLAPFRRNQGIRGMAGGRE